MDALSFGATKNGALLGEAVVFLRPELADGVAYLRKQTLQLASKGRYLAAQYIALLEGDLWRRNAAHANAMAARLALAIAGVPGIRITQAVEANAVFAVISPAAAEALQRDFHFYVWDEPAGEVRWMCSWDTTPAGRRRVRRGDRAGVRGPRSKLAPMSRAAGAMVIRGILALRM